MPRGPRGEKRPADVIGNAVKVAQIATGEVDDDIEGDGGDSAARSLGKKGGAARAARLSAAERRSIARKAAEARWRKD